MFGGLAAYQRTAGLNTAVGNALDDRGYLCRLVLSAGDVVKEEQRFRAAADDVVHTHCHRVDTDSIVLVQKERKLYLCSNAVGAGNEDRIVILLRVKLEQTAEAAYAVDSALYAGALDVLFHKANRLISCGNVNARSLVTFGMTVFHTIILSVFKSFFAVPAVSAEPVFLQSHGSYGAGERLELKRGEF